jgi:ribosomal protein S17
LDLFKSKTKQEVNGIVYAESRFSEKLQKMQIVCANHLHVEKEIPEEILRRYQKEGGNKNIVNVGDHVECPECRRMSHVVWVSKDGKTAGIQCPASHRLTSRPASRLGTVERPQSKTCKNMVFITESK